MARIRSVHPEQWTDDQFVTCSPLARLMAIGVRNYADDNGVFEATPLKLKMRIFPGDNCDAGELLAELEATDQIFRFEHEGKPFAVIRNFTKYQRPKKPSFAHPFPAGDLPAGYEPHQSYLEANSEPVGNQFGTSGENGPHRRVEKGREGDKDNSLRSLSSSGDSAEPAKSGKQNGKKALRDVAGNLINKQWVIENIFGPYGEKLPGLPQPVASRWDSKTAGGKALMARLAEDDKHRDPAFWDWFWTAAASNPHWRGDNGWTPNGIAWFFSRTNFDNVVTRGVDNQKRGITNV